MKVECHIITDLLPSYLEDLLSEETKQDVIQHLSNCEKCRKVSEEMKSTISLDVPKINVASIDYFKKVTLHFIRKNIFTLCILLLTVVLLHLYVSNFGILPNKLLYITLPILCFCGYFIFSNNLNQNTKAGKSAIVLSGISISVFLLELLFMFTLNLWVHNMTTSSVGPFVLYTLYIVLFMELVVIIYSLIQAIKKSYLYYFITELGITAACVSVSFISSLHTLSSPEAARCNRWLSLLLLAEGFVIALCTYFIMKRTYSKTR